MVDEPRPLAGAQFFIGTNLAVNYDLADAAVKAAADADSFTEIGWVEDGGEIGDNAGEVTFIPVSARRVAKYKTSFDAGQSEYIVAHVTGDGGQAALLAAFLSDDDFNFKIVLNDEPADTGGTPTTIYAAGKVASKPFRLGNVENIVRRVFRISWNSRPVEIPASG